MGIFPRILLEIFHVVLLRGFPGVSSKLTFQIASESLVYEILSTDASLNYHYDSYSYICI